MFWVQLLHRHGSTVCVWQCLRYLISHVTMSQLMTIELIKEIFYSAFMLEWVYFSKKVNFVWKVPPHLTETMAPLVFYHSPVSPFSRSVHLLVRYLKIDADVTVMDLQEKRDHLTPEFLAINPQHCVRFFKGIFIWQGVMATLRIFLKSSNIC